MCPQRRGRWARRHVRSRGPRCAVDALARAGLRSRRRHALRRRLEAGYRPAHAFRSPRPAADADAGPPEWTCRPRRPYLDGVGRRGYLTRGGERSRRPSRLPPSTGDVPCPRKPPRTCGRRDPPWFAPLWFAPPRPRALVSVNNTVGAKIGENAWPRRRCAKAPRHRGRMPTDRPRVARLGPSCSGWPSGAPDRGSHGRHGGAVEGGR